MAIVSPYLLIIALNLNDLNYLIKTQKVADLIFYKKDPTIYSL